MFYLHMPMINYVYHTSIMYTTRIITNLFLVFVIFCVFKLLCSTHDSHILILIVSHHQFHCYLSIPLVKYERS